MKVQTKILILLSGIVALSIAVLTILVVGEHGKVALYIRELRDQTIVSFDTTLKLKGDSLETYAFDYTYWDEMVNFISAPVDTWGEQNIEESLPTYKANAAWVFRKDFSLRYYVDTFENSLKKDIPFEVEQVKKMFEGQNFCHFFVPTEKGLMEIRGATIHPSDDPERKTPWLGYFFVGRIWDKAYLAEISKITRTQVRISGLSKPIPVESPADEKSGTIRFSILLQGWDQKPIAHLDIRKENPVVHQLNLAADRQFWIQLLASMILLLITSLLLIRWVSRPLHEITQSLDKENPSLLYEMKNQKSEFGNIARLIIQFFEQKKALDREIAERKMTEKALEEEKERMAVTLRSIAEGLIAISLNGRILLMNKKAEEMTGITHEVAFGKPLSEIFQVLDGKTHLPAPNPVEKVLKSDSLIVTDDQNILVSHDGKERRIAECAAPLKDKNSEIIGVVLVFRDITLEKKIENEMLKSSKLETVSLLASGIAHDFNNILVGILGNISLAKMEGNGKWVHLLDNAQKAALHAKNLTAQLLTFAKGGAPIMKTTSIEDVIRESVDFALRGSNIHCNFRFEEGLWPAELDAGQMIQVVQNIVINACQAMPDGGSIEMTAENSSKGPEDVYPQLMKKFIKISIQDHGSGIKEENLSRIFDPFFTTKSRGSGLGLATCYSIVKNHDGFITVNSRWGKGTTFYIYLPASEAKIVKIAKPDEKPIMGKGRILVVDDEEMVRDVASQMLQRLGYEAECAIDGTDALDKYKNARGAGKPFDALITDLTIPGGMGGLEAVQKLLQIDPHVKAIVSSGYSSDPIMSDYKKYGFKGVIAKPYLIQDLGQVLHNILREKQAAA